MAERRYIVGERIRASRAQDGRGHEEATVYDYYELLMEGDRIPQVVVDFDDGERVWMAALEPNVMPIEEDEVSDELDVDDEFLEEEEQDGEADEEGAGGDDGWDDAGGE